MSTPSGPYSEDPTQWTPAAGYQPAPNPYPQPYAPPGYPPYAPPPAKPNRAALIIVGAIVAVLALVGGAVLLASRSSGGAKGGDPGKVVVAYLNALANGHADEALSYGSSTPDKRFLTDTVLQQQQAKAKISGVNILAVRTNSSQASVSAQYLFGTDSETAYYALAKVKGAWRLNATTTTIRTSSITDVPDLTLYGTAVDGSSIQVFPGPLNWGSSNKNYAVTDRYDDEFPTSPSSYSYASLTVALSDTGKTALNGALKAAIDKCAGIKTASATGCPQKVYAYDSVANSFTWSVVGDVGDYVRYNVGYSDPSMITLSGYVKMHATFQRKDYDGKITNDSDDVSAYLYNSKVKVDGGTFTVTLSS